MNLPRFYPRFYPDTFHPLERGKIGVKTVPSRLVLVGYKISKALRSTGLPPVLCYYLQRSLQLGLVLATGWFYGAGSMRRVPI